MRLVQADGRAGLLVDEQVFDVERLSAGRVSHEVADALARWDELVAVSPTDEDEGAPLHSLKLGPPVAPPMILAVVANHPPAERSPFPMVVGKSPTSVVGPFDEVVLPDSARLPLKQAWVIPEPELGVVVRGGGRHLDAAAAAEAIAGYLVVQDVTERAHEFGPERPPWQWDGLPAKTLGKSFDTFCPIGPALVSPDELPDPRELVVRCWINGDLVFENAVGELLWSPAELVALVSSFMALRDGLLILCGCGSPVGGGAIPFLQPGDLVRTEIGGIGTMSNRCRADSAPEDERTATAVT